MQERDVTENEARTLLLSIDALAVGPALPTPLWISEARYVPLELERTYEDTCCGLRIP